MGFWIYMFITTLFIPLILLFFGRYFLKSAPKKINYILGYRTNMSMKNKDTWEFAHKYCGKLWCLAGTILLPVSILTMLLVFNKSTDTISIVGSILLVVELIPVVGSIIPTEIALRKTFDKNGNRR